MLRGIKFLFILLILSSLLTGCGKEIVYKKNLTLVDYKQMKDSEDFIIATFKDRKGHKYKYAMHETYTNVIEKGKEYDIGYVKKSLFRPDNEIIRLNPFEKLFY
jgi:hypothetical protein